MCSAFIAQLVEHSKSIMDTWDKIPFGQVDPDPNGQNESRNNGNYLLPRKTDKLALSRKTISPDLDANCEEMSDKMGESHPSVESLKSDEHDFEEAEYEGEYESDIEYEYVYDDDEDHENGNYEPHLEIEEMDDSIEENQFIVIDYKIKPVFELEVESRELQQLDDEDVDMESIDLGPEDVTFAVGYQNEKISAHKRIVCKQSPVFQEILRKNPKKDIRVPDADPEDFKAFLQCLYKRKPSELLAIADVETAFELSYLSNKYKINGISERAKVVIQELITEQNAASILEKATMYNDQAFYDVAFEFICKNTDKVFASKAFTQLSHDNLCRLLEQDSLTIDELPLFNAVFRWAISFLNRKVIDGNADILRNALAEPLHLIRFNLMSLEDFVTCVCETRVLTTEREKGIAEYLSLPTCERNVNSLSAFLFKTNSRYALYVPRDCYVVERIPRHRPLGLGDDIDLYSKNAWGFSFETNRPIYLTAVGVYGPKGNQRMECRVKLEVVELNSKDGNKIISETDTEQDFRLYNNIFYVELCKPVKIMHNQKYIIRFQILKGPSTAICKSAVKESQTWCRNGEKVVFTYGEYCQGFLTTTNQLPEIIFKLAPY